MTFYDKAVDKFADVTWTASSTNFTQVFLYPYATGSSLSAGQIVWLEDQLWPKTGMTVERAHALNNGTA